MIIFFFIQIQNNKDQTTMPTALVNVVLAKEGNFAETINAYGSLSPVLQNQWVMISGGNVEIGTIKIAPYTAVKKGERLLALRPTPEVQANLKNAKDNLQHLEILRQQYLATNTEVAAAQATYSSLQALYGKKAKWLLAPADGIVGAIFVRTGEIASSGNPLLNFSAKGKIGATLSVTLDEAAQITKGDKVTLFSVGHPHLTLMGQVSSVSNQLNDQTKLIDVQVIISELPTNPIIDSPLQAEIEITYSEPRILLPRNAVLYQNNQPYVFIDNDHNAVQRKVIVAGENKTEVAIASGIRVGDLVVVTGNYELEDGMPLMIQERRS